MKLTLGDIKYLIFLLIASLLLTACASRAPDSRASYYSDDQPAGNLTYSENGAADDDGRSIVDGSAAVLGVVASQNAMREFKRKILANDLEAMVREQQPQLTLLPYNQLHAALRKQGIHQILLNRYRISPQLGAEDWQILRDSGLRVRYLLIARVEVDEARKINPIPSRVRNDRGEILTDRQKISLMHERVVQVSAKSYDMATGDIVWSDTIVQRPSNSYEYTKYTGSSFTSSVATSLANSLVHGRLSAKYPPAPSSSDAMDEVFRAIAQKMTGELPPL